ncbi:MAG: hypothetical protein DSZ33_05735 [Gammaproteobacteria bacterium]|nr:MAG: hypothetical protein DSZ33_05735 [Gammaproteobacteria bacterium]
MRGCRSVGSLPSDCSCAMAEDNNVAICCFTSASSRMGKRRILQERLEIETTIPIYADNDEHNPEVTTMSAIIKGGAEPRWPGVYEDLFENFFRPVRNGDEKAAGGLIPAMDIVEQDDAYKIIVDLPGVTQDDIDVTVHEGVLTINAERKAENIEKDDQGRVIRQERRYGKYIRSVKLAQDVQEDKVEAKYKDGVLELVLPKKEEVKPKKISVNVE